ncbi:hypothetical protein L535_3420 [Bordetella bronchiseptica SBL-F6116]|nr:hypothetical protein [Bordetella bronchiseptica]KCV36272.1 hypothetical protein L489_3773 [Bordetella bronchiseptica 00-P-2730]KDE01533.1 hypothetical protein L535_3420 [Bordetella bronchiseptica SBL-F6116]
MPAATDPDIAALVARGWYDLTASAAGQSLRLAGRTRAAGPGRPDPRLG